MTSRSTPPRHIGPRRTVDWSDVPAFRARRDRSFAPKVEAWNATVQLPCHLFGQERRSIAQANLDQVGGGGL